ncbi:MAG TPA: diacylglycerol kinase family protein [Candidatus Sulfotelmatobacter sp.]|nr:diacylglycerol kinase family protein [Candidatus Sulfotelmatobacter sp.]
MRVGLIDNPHSFRGPYPVHRVRPILAAAGWRTSVYARTPGGATGALVARALDDGAEVVVAAGGDGTLRDVASALAGSRVPLGVLPGGTANVFAREMAIPRQPEAAAWALVEGAERAFDLGRVTIPGGGWGRFLIAAGLGLDGAILAATRSDLKRVTGPLAIAAAALAVAPRWRPRAVRVRVDGAAAWDGEAWQLIVGNTRLYANLVWPSPLARPDDGLLDLCILPAAPMPRLARLGVGLAVDRVPPASGAVWLVGRTIHVDVVDGELPLQLDGTPVRGPGIRSADLVAEPAALVVRLPSGGPAGHASEEVPRP